MSPALLKPLEIPPVKLMAAVAIMALSLLGGEGLQPHKYWADALGSPHYAHIIPSKFGEWVELKNTASVIVDPIQAENIEKLYSETLARNYLHVPSGRVIMLSIAYGRDQSTDTQIHTPDMCYPSQGFKVINRQDHEINTPYGPLKSVELDTTQGTRHEPLTYFIRVGDKVVRGSLDRNLERLSRAIRGYRVDGMLFRVSEITPDPSSAYALQDQFVQDLLSALSAKDRTKVIGSTRVAGQQ